MEGSRFILNNFIWEEIIMDNTKFANLLFDIACSSVTCDGHIDEREIKELKRINTTTAYFKDIDLWFKKG